MNYKTLEEILSVLRSPEIEHFDKLGYRILLIEICYLLNQHMALGQHMPVTHVLGREYARVTEAYHLLSKNFNEESVIQVKATAVSAIETVQQVLVHRRADKPFHYDNTFSRL